MNVSEIPGNLLGMFRYGDSIPLFLFDHSETQRVLAVYRRHDGRVPVADPGIGHQVPHPDKIPVTVPAHHNVQNLCLGAEPSARVKHVFRSFHSETSGGDFGILRSDRSRNLVKGDSELPQLFRVNRDVKLLVIIAHNLHTPHVRNAQKLGLQFLGKKFQASWRNLSGNIDDNNRHPCMGVNIEKKGIIRAGRKLVLNI